MGNHTPGPWTVWHAKAYYNGDEPEFRRLFMIDAKHGDGTMNQANADCDLIEAAPDLLEACRAALEVECGWNPHSELANIIRAAISKAEGRG